MSRIAGQAEEVLAEDEITPSPPIEKVQVKS
jgi:hypothetical protein